MVLTPISSPPLSRNSPASWSIGTSAAPPSAPRYTRPSTLRATRSSAPTPSNTAPVLPATREVLPGKGWNSQNFILSQSSDSSSQLQKCDQKSVASFCTTLLLNVSQPFLPMLFHCSMFGQFSWREKSKLFKFAANYSNSVWPRCLKTNKMHKNCSFPFE